MSGRTLYDIELRRRAVELYEEGHGRDVISYLLNVPEGTVRQWPDTYRSVGMGALTAMGTKKTAYSFEAKVAAARAVADEGMTVPEAMAEFGIASTSPLGKWLKAYREGGPEALRPKPKGRPKGAKAASEETTREQELERRIQKLEAENAYLKKSMALKAEKRSRTARKQRSRTSFQGFTLFSTCWEAARLPRSSYYYAPSHPKAPTRPELRDAVGEIFSRTPNGCGHRQIAMCLRAEQGVAIADKTVLKIMHEMGISCGIRRETDYHKHNSYKGRVGETFENVIGRDFGADGPWEKMGADVTEFKQTRGKACFAPVYDFASKEIVAWSTSLHPNMARQYGLIDQLLAKMPEGSTPILHSDSKNVASRFCGGGDAAVSCNRDRVAAS